MTEIDNKIWKLFYIIKNISVKILELENQLKQTGTELCQAQQSLSYLLAESPTEKINYIGYIFAL